MRNGTKRRSKGIILTTRTLLGYPRRTIPKRRPPQPLVLPPWRNKAAFRPHRLADEPRRGLQPPLQPPRRVPLGLAPRHSRKLEMHPPLHLWPSHLRPLRARSSPGKPTSINLNHRPRHQGEPHRRRLHLRVPHRVWYLDHARTCPHLHLPLHLRALTVLEDGWGQCLESRRGSSGRPCVVLGSRKAASGGSAQPKGRKRRGGGRGKEEDPAKDGGSSSKGEGRGYCRGKRVTRGRGPAAAPQPLIFSYGRPAWVRATPAVPIAARPAIRRYVGPHCVGR